MVSIVEFLGFKRLHDLPYNSEEDIQLTRLMDRNHLSEADAKKRIKLQMPLEQKCGQSHFVIENSGTFAMQLLTFAQTNAPPPPPPPPILKQVLSRTRRSKR